MNAYEFVALNKKQLDNERISMLNKDGNK